MSDDVLVRAARSADLDGLLALYAELGEGGQPAAERGRAQAVLDAALADPARHLLVAALRDELLGTVDMVIVPNLRHGARPWAVVENVVVTERWRGAGVGRRLMGRAFQLAREADCYKVQLLSRKQRVQAHAFYRGLGMEAVAEGFRIFFDETV